MVRDLSTHGKPEHRVDGRDVKFLGEELVLCAHAIHVFDGGREIGGVGGGAGFSVAEEGDEDDFVGGEGAGGVGEGGGETAFEAGVDDGDLFILGV